MHLMILLGFVPQTWYRGNTKDSRSFFAFDFVTHSVYKCVNVVYSTGAKIENRIGVVKGGRGGCFTLNIILEKIPKTDV